MDLKLKLQKCIGAQGEKMVQSTEQKRIEWIDRLKAFAIIMVIFGHLHSDSLETSIIYACHLPVFFFASGLVFDINRYPSFKYFLKKKTLDILLPGTIFSIIICIERIITIKTREETVIQLLLAILLKIRYSPYDDAMWFISLIFFAEIFLFFLIKITKNNAAMICLLSFIMFIVGYCYIIFVNFNLPWNLDTTFTIMPFIGVGYCSKKNVEKIHPLFLIGIIPYIAFAQYNLKNVYGFRVDMFYNLYGQPVIFLINAFIGIVTLIAFSKLLNIRIFNYIGRRTLLLYGGQTLLLEKFYEMEKSIYFRATLHKLEVALELTLLFLVIILLFDKPYHFILGNIKKKLV